MITNAMIRKLAKPYTKRTMANEGPKVGKTVWSNSMILFWETPPAFVANHYAAEEKPQLDTITIPDDMPTLYPVEIRERDSISFPCVKLIDGNGHTHWLNGKLVSAALRQANRQAKHVTFAFCAAEAEGKTITGILVQLLDRPLALIGLLNEDYLGLDEHAPDWQLMNNDLPTIRQPAAPPEYIAPENVSQPRLCEEKAQYSTKEIHSGKFVMLCISCMVLDSYDPLKPYRGASITYTTERQRKAIDHYAKKLDITLAESRGEYTYNNSLITIRKSTAGRGTERT